MKKKSAKKSVTKKQPPKYKLTYSLEHGMDSFSDWKRIVDHKQIEGVVVKRYPSPYMHHSGIMFTATTMEAARQVIVVLRQNGISWVQRNDIKRIESIYF